MVMSFQAVEPLKHDNAHARPEGLDPKVNGPFLDDVRADQERAYRDARNKNAVQFDDTEELEVVEEEEDNEPDGE
jgi:hypothetical protein